MADAIAEMNRYGRVAVAIEGPAADLKVSGVFRIGDSEAFAQAVATVHDLAIERSTDRIVLAAKRN